MFMYELLFFQLLLQVSLFFPMPCATFLSLRWYRHKSEIFQFFQAPTSFVDWMVNETIIESDTHFHFGTIFIV